MNIKRMNRLNKQFALKSNAYQEIIRLQDILKTASLESNKTNWTPLTSQEHLDEVWEKMKVGEIIYIMNTKKDKIDYSNTKVSKNHIDTDLEFYKNDGYTILTPYSNG